MTPRNALIALVLVVAAASIGITAGAPTLKPPPRPSRPPSPPRPQKSPPSPAPPSPPFPTCGSCPTASQSCVGNACVENGDLRFSLFWEGAADVDVWITTPLLAWGGSKNAGALANLPAQLPTFQKFPSRGVVSLYYDSILAPLGTYHVCAQVSKSMAPVRVGLNVFAISGNYQLSDAAKYGPLQTNQTWSPKAVNATVDYRELCDPFHPGYIASVKLCQWGKCNETCRFVDGCATNQVCYFETYECTDACGVQICSKGEACSAAVPGTRPQCVKQLSPPPSPPTPPGSARCGSTWACSKTSQACIKSTCVSNGQLRFTLTWDGPKSGDVDWTPLALTFTDPRWTVWNPFDPETTPTVGNFSVEVDDLKGGVQSVVWRSAPLPGPYQVCALGVYDQSFKNVKLYVSGRLSGTALKTATYSRSTLSASDDYVCTPYHPGYLATIEVCSASGCGASCSGSQCAPGQFCYGAQSQSCTDSCGGYVFCPADQQCSLPTKTEQLPTCAKRV